jgi:hypothetical protein
MLEAAGRVRRLVFQVKVDVPIRRERKGNQVGIRRAIGVGLNQPDRLVCPRPRRRIISIQSLHHSAHPDLIIFRTDLPRNVTNTDGLMPSTYATTTVGYTTGHHTVTPEEVRTHLIPGADLRLHKTSGKNDHLGAYDLIGRQHLPAEAPPPLETHA